MEYIDEFSDQEEIIGGNDQKYSDVEQEDDNEEEDDVTESSQPAVADIAAEIVVEQKQETQEEKIAEEKSNADEITIRPEGIQMSLHNIVSTVDLGCKLVLKQIAQKARNAEYNPKKFGAVVMRIRDPKSTALIFSSGKMVVCGAKSVEMSKFAGRKFARIVQKLGFENAKFKDFKLRNVVGSCDVRFPIRLEGLAAEHEEYASYEPELFPGLIYRLRAPKLTVLIFVSGKVVITGAKSKEDLNHGLEAIFPVLLQYKKNAYGDLF